MSETTEATSSPQTLRVAVTLDVTTRVVVEIATDSAKTVDEMRRAAQEKFDRAGGTEYKNQFRSDTSISLVSTDVQVGQLRTVEKRGW